MSNQFESTWIAILTLEVNLSGQTAHPDTEIAPVPPEIDCSADRSGGADSTVTVLHPIFVAPPALAPAQMHTGYVPGARVTVPVKP
jgi:hypothetical protein